MKKGIASVWLVCVMLLVLSMGSRAQEKTTITFASWFGGVDLENAESAIDLFERLHPDINVEVEIIPFGEYFEKMQLRAAADVLPDVVLTIASRAQLWITQDIILADVSPLIEREDPSFDFKDYWPNIMPAYGDGKGGVYALPYDISMFTLWYNADLMNQAALPTPGPEEVWQWDRFLANARRMTQDKNGDGDSDKWGLWNLPRSWGLFAFLGQNDGRMFNIEKTASTVNSPAVADVYQWWVDARFNYGITPPPGSSAPRGFQTGIYGFQMEGPWSIPGMRASARFHYDVAPLPRGKRRYNVVDGGAFALGKGSKHPEAAWEFIKFYTGQRNLERVTGEPGRGIPGRISAAESFVTDQLPNERVFLNEIYVSEPIGQLAPPNYLNLQGDINRTTNSIFNGEISVNSALENLETTLNAKLKNYYETLGGQDK